MTNVINEWNVDKYNSRQKFCAAKILRGENFDWRKLYAKKFLRSENSALTKFPAAMQLWNFLPQKYLEQYVYISIIAIKSQLYLSTLNLAKIKQVPGYKQGNTIYQSFNLRTTQSRIIGAVRGAHSQLWGTIIPVCSLYAGRKYARRFGTPAIVWFTGWN